MQRASTATTAVRAESLWNERQEAGTDRRGGAVQTAVEVALAPAPHPDEQTAAAAACARAVTEAAAAPRACPELSGVEAYTPDEGAGPDHYPAVAALARAQLLVLPALR